MRNRLVVVVVLATAWLATSAEAAAPSPKTQSQQLAAAQKTFAAALSTAEQKTIELQKNLNTSTACAGAAPVPKNEQSAEFGMFFSWAVVTGGEMVAPLYVGYARDVAGLHLTDPALKRYAGVLQQVSAQAASLRSANPAGLCAVLLRWQKLGYPKSGLSFATQVFGLTSVQATALDTLGTSNPQSNAFKQAKVAADARLREFGVTPVPVP